MKVDVAVIGAGTAGLNARRAAAKEGASVVMIESGPYGTTCARVGCMPSKLLIHPAEIAHEIRQAERFGIYPGEVKVDTRAILKRVRAERDRFVGFVSEAVERIPEEQKLRGHARFLDDHTLDVDGTRVEARSIVIATGTYPWTPPVLEGVRESVITNEEFFEQEELPDSVAVFGMGVVGLELGQAMHRLGTRVAFFDPTPGYGFVSDPVVRKKIREVFDRELEMYPGSTVQSAVPVESGVKISWLDEWGKSHESTFSKIFSAAGRRPNLGNLGLENTSMQLDSRGMPQIDHRTQQIEDKPVFVAGDVTGFRQLLHEAADEGRTAGMNAAQFPNVRAQERRASLSIVFTDPQIAIAGSRLSELNMDETEVGEVDYSDQGRSRVMGKNAGIVRIYATKACGILRGAEMFGPRVENTAHLLAWSIQQRMSVQKALSMPFYHPVVEEGLRTALRDLEESLKFADVPCIGDETRFGAGA